MPRSSPKKLAFAGLSAALITLLTAFVRLYIPMSHGYAHMGDAAIFISGALLGPFAYLPAGVGSAMADILSGYAIYAPFTFVIKAVMAILAGKYLSQNRLKNALYCVLIALFMVAAYFGTDTLLFGLPAAVSSVLGNLTQGGFSCACALCLLPHLKKPNL